MTNDMPQPPSPTATRRIPIALGAVLIGVLIGFAGVYGIGGLNRGPSGDPACRGAVDLARKLAPLVHGEVAALTIATAPLRVPDLTFEDGQGKPKRLSDWRGRTLLVNLWAASCGACRQEKAALDTPRSRVGGANFAGVAVNNDNRGPEKA